METAVESRGRVGGYDYRDAVGNAVGVITLSIRPQREPTPDPSPGHKDAESYGRGLGRPQDVLGSAYSRGWDTGDSLRYGHSQGALQATSLFDYCFVCASQTYRTGLMLQTSGLCMTGAGRFFAVQGFVYEAALGVGGPSVQVGISTDPNLSGKSWSLSTPQGEFSLSSAGDGGSYAYSFPPTVGVSVTQTVTVEITRDEALRDAPDDFDGWGRWLDQGVRKTLGLPFYLGGMSVRP